jgi:hypothetical protein
MTDDTQRETADAGRRGFLKLAAAAPVAAAAVAGTAGEARAAPAEGHQAGLADTAQARAYYSSARF